MSSILQALLGASQQEYQQDPFLQGARGLNSIDQSQYDMSPAQRILFGALQGLGGGFAKGVGESRVENKMLDRSNKLMEAQKQGKIYEALLEDPQMAGFAPLYQMEQEAAKTERLQELNKALLPKGMMLDEAGGVKQLWDPIAMAADEKRRTAQAEIEGKRAAYAGTDWNGLEPKDIADLETKYTLELTKGPTAQNIIELQSRAEQVLNAIKTRDPLNAAAAIYGMAKVLDPAGVVRKEDGTIVANPGGPAGQLESIYNTLVQKGQLTDDTVRAMQKLVPELAAGTYRAYAAQRDSMIGAAEKQGAKRDRIGFIPEPKFDMAQPSAQVAPDISEEEIMAELQRRSANKWGVR